jgi:hypothetical protein
MARAEHTYKCCQNRNPFHLWPPFIELNCHPWGSLDLLNKDLLLQDKGHLSGGASEDHPMNGMPAIFAAKHVVSYLRKRDAKGEAAAQTDRRF